MTYADCDMWKREMEEEILSLHENATLEIIRLPKNPDTANEFSLGNCTAMVTSSEGRHGTDYDEV